MQPAELLAYIGGGIGDQACAEPALRYALNRFEGEINISLLTHYPELFSHLRLKDVFTVTPNERKPEFEKYIVRGTYPIGDPSSSVPANNDMYAFCPVHINGVDYCCLQLMKWMIPFEDREIQLIGEYPKESQKQDLMELAFKTNAVIIHPGLTWPSRSFPAAWWREVVDGIGRMGATPILIGKNNSQAGNGVVPLGSIPGVIDMTGRFSLKEMIYLLQRVRVVVTNDSMPIHLAASYEPNAGETGGAWIGYLSTAKHPDFLKHQRRGGFGWQMENFAKGGIWSKKATQGDAKLATDEEIRSWLPVPSVIARWAVMKGRE